MVYIYVNSNVKIKNIDDVKYGNPGIGGSEFLLLQLFYYLKIYGDINCKLIALNNSIVGDDIINIANQSELFNILSESIKSKLVFIPKDLNLEFYNKIDNMDIFGIAWVHNYVSYNVIDILNKYEFIKKIVFVGREHFESYIDSKIYNKSNFIYNMIQPSNFNYMSPYDKENIVTYVGALIQPKGFHILAKQWKKILRKVPDAKLQVIGGGNLYNNSVKLGQYGIADEKYEKKFIKYLTKKGKILDSVKFLGVLGNEKSQYIIKSKVGVANPSGVSETFCLSAVEYKMYGIPVVSYNGFGLLDTVRNKIDGILIRNGFQLRKAIIKLLSDSDLNMKIGYQGYVDGYQKYLPEMVIPEWLNLFNDIDQMEKVEISNKNLLNDLKWLKILNYKLCKALNIKNNGVSYSISKLKKKIKKMVKKNA